MVEKHSPRKGSLGFSPRKRAAEETPKFGSFPEGDEPQVQGFLGYKVGMTHVLMIEDRPNTPAEGMEVQKPVTVLEVPPITVTAVKGCEKRHDGLATITEASDEDGVDDLEEALPRIERVSVIASADPSGLSGVPKGKEDEAELWMGGDAEAALDAASDLLGEEVTFSDLFDSGEQVDVTAVTKGKGNSGPVKRWGVKVQNRKAQRKGKGRHIGNLGPWHPTRVRWQVPQQGQMGYHNRTELNKRILDIGDDPGEVNPEGGFKNYGEVQGDYVIVHGSVPGPEKRTVGIRKAIRPKDLPDNPSVKQVSTSSKQGG